MALSGMVHHASVTFIGGCQSEDQLGPMVHTLPETGFLRLPRIIGNPKAKAPIPASIPVCKSTPWAGGFRLR